MSLETIDHLLEEVSISKTLSVVEKVEIMRFFNTFLLNYNENIEALNKILENNRRK